MRRHRLLAVVILAALALLAGIGLVEKARRGRASSSTTLFDFERGFSGWDVRVEGNATVVPLLSERETALGDGSRAFAAQIAAEGGWAEVRFFRDTDCAVWPHPSVRLRLYTSPSLAGARVYAFTLSGRWRYLAGEPLRLEAGANELEVRFHRGGEPSPRVLSVAGTDTSRLCRLGFAVELPADRPVSGLLALDALHVERRPPLPLARTPAPLPPATAEVRVAFQNPGSPVPPQPMGLELASDVARDEAFVEALRGMGTGLVRIPLYPALGQQSDALKGSGRRRLLERIDATVETVLRAGWQPVVSVGSTPSWVPEAERPSLEEWSDTALAVLDHLNRVRRRGVRFWELRPWERLPPSPDGALLQALGSTASRM